LKVIELENSKILLDLLGEVYHLLLCFLGNAFKLLNQSDELNPFIKILKKKKERILFLSWVSNGDLTL